MDWWHTTLQCTRARLDISIARLCTRVIYHMPRAYVMYFTCAHRFEFLNVHCCLTDIPQSMTSNILGIRWASAVGENRYSLLNRHVIIDIICTAPCTADTYRKCPGDPDKMPIFLVEWHFRNDFHCQAIFVYFPCFAPPLRRHRVKTRKYVHLHTFHQQVLLWVWYK